MLRKLSLKLSPSKSKPTSFFDPESTAPSVKLTLGAQNLEYINQEWKSDLESDYTELLKVVEGLQERNRDLEMENSMVKYKVCLGCIMRKVSVLVDLLTASKLDLLEFQSRVMNMTMANAAEKNQA
jgi:hypothetical protein